MIIEIGLKSQLYSYIQTCGHGWLAIKMRTSHRLSKANNATNAHSPAHNIEFIFYRQPHWFFACRDLLTSLAISIGSSCGAFRQQFLSRLAIILTNAKSLTFNMIVFFISNIRTCFRLRNLICNSFMLSGTKCRPSVEQVKSASCTGSPEHIDTFFADRIDCRIETKCIHMLSSMSNISRSNYQSRAEKSVSVLSMHSDTTSSKTFSIGIL